MTVQPDSDRRPPVAVGHVSLAVGDVGATTAFFLKFGLRKIFASKEIAVLELRGGTHLILRGAGDDKKGEKPTFDLMFDDLESARSTAVNGGEKWDHRGGVKRDQARYWSCPRSPREGPARAAACPSHG